MYGRFVIICISLALALPVGSADHTDSQDYLAPGGDAVGDCGSFTGAANIGGVCFYPDGESIVTLTIEDALAPKAAGYVEFRDERGNALEAKIVCGTGTFDLPLGTHEVRVFLDGAFALLDCNDTTPATTGTVTAEFF